MSTEAHEVLSSVGEKLGAGRDLSRQEARATMDAFLAGAGTPAQIGAILMGLRQKGETEEEVSGFAAGLRAAGVRIAPRRGPLVDLCGTGGDGSGTFNISTAASLVAAGAGAVVAKHGNRSASSRCGSADVLEALGVPVSLAPERACAAIEEVGFAFLFAPLYHPAMKHVGPVRKELRVRTVFNILGPLANPAGARRQLLGVFDGAVRAMMARVLRELGAEAAWVVHGEGGLDEISIEGETEVAAFGTEGTGAGLAELRLRPADFGITPCSRLALLGGDAALNARLIAGVLRGEKGPHRDATLVNAAAALLVAGLAADLREGMARAAASVDSGAALRVLEAARRFQ
jgi:anthranilate phosphoribosyltransferase